ncbi:MAG: membrane protein insertion efficiency factor YidD [Bacteroidetes bacterium]|nr:MAG: membrane protein insertion efficiency factor YidD [Bacteroidota bacterium]
MIRVINKILTTIFLIPVKFYQWFISPMLPQTCRHTPTCSQYTVESLKKHGPFTGTWLSVRRLSKCHPWGTWGYDPVPDENYRIFNFKKYKTNKKH